MGVFGIYKDSRGERGSSKEIRFIDGGRDERMGSRVRKRNFKEERDVY